MRCGYPGSHTNANRCANVSLSCGTSGGASALRSGLLRDPCRAYARTLLGDAAAGSKAERSEQASRSSTRQGPLSVKSGKAQIEHKFCGSPPKADVSEARRHVREVPKAAIRRTLRQALSGFCQGSSYVSDATDESLHYGAYHSVFQRDDPDGPWPNRKVDRQYFEWGSVGAKTQHGTG